MNKKALSILEYEKIVALLEAYGGSHLTREKIKSLAPITEVIAVKEELRSTTEGVDLIVRKGAMPTSGVYDVVSYVNFAVKGGTLTPKELLEVKYNLRIANSTITFMSDENKVTQKNIWSLVELLDSVNTLEKEIEKCIISEDEISDNASTELKNIRRQIVRQKEAVRIRLNKMVSSSTTKDYLQDSLVTMRNGRYVIPVKQEHRGKFPGMIHDQSKGGSTIFVEPEAIVNMNNELRELMIEEEKEIARILALLSSKVAEHKYSIINNQKLLVELDFIMAKAKLSISMNGQAPEIIENKRVLKLINASHPLIQGDNVVPITLELGETYRTLIITGPNTGGKTVSLKTAGLLTMMAQSGLHIPASSSSTVPIFKNIFADIGDEQSIEQNLSTFSSHMKNIVNILEEADENSLVLLDEMGAGTDPTEGAALAIAVLENLFDKKSLVMATTHYNEIKKYALSTEGVENGSMEFDIETLSPTYRLLVGVAGKSNAFEISTKLGIKSSIIERARKLIDDKDLEFQQVIGAIERDRKKAEEELLEAKRIREDIKIREENLEKQLEMAEKEKSQMMASAREESRKIIKDARRVSKEIQKELKALSKEESLGLRNQRFEKARTNLREAEKEYSEPIVKSVNKKPVKASEIKVGSVVKVLTLGQNGKILSLPDNRNQCNVQVGGLKLKVALDDMVLLQGNTMSKTKKEKTKYSGLYKKAAKRISPTVNVQGKNLDDAIMEIGKYLDDAFIAGLEKVTIIHGRGEGILKNGIRQELKYNKQVKSYKAGNYDEGGEGVTNVTLKIR